MRVKLNKFILRLLAYISLIFSTLIIFHIDVLYAAESDNSVLIKKFSKSYTNKFCNSIGFGLSKESAMKFSIKENKQAFKKRKDIDDINKEFLAKEIAISVVEKCGYPIKLTGEKGIIEFKNYYLSKDKDY